MNSHILLLVVVFVIVLALCVARQRTGGRGPRRRDITKDLRASPRTKFEAAVIDIIEKITGGRFPTVLPSWLVHNGRQIELDGYNADLGIAIEVNGPLHYKPAPGESIEAYLERVKRDAIKKKICAERGIAFIVVDTAVPMGYVYDYIRSRLHDAGKAERPVNYLPVIERSPWIPGH